MGGVLLLGYDVRDRRMLINPAEAEKVKHIYERYLELGCVRQLSKELEWTRRPSSRAAKSTRTTTDRGLTRVRQIGAHATATLIRPLSAELVEGPDGRMLIATRVLQIARRQRRRGGFAERAGEFA